MHPSKFSLDPRVIDDIIFNSLYCNQFETFYNGDTIKGDSPLMKLMRVAMET